MFCWGIFCVHVSMTHIHVRKNRYIMLQVKHAWIPLKEYRYCTKCVVHCTYKTFSPGSSGKAVTFKCDMCCTVISPDSRQWGGSCDNPTSTVPSSYCAQRWWRQQWNWSAKDHIFDMLIFCSKITVIWMSIYKGCSVEKCVCGGGV